MIEKDEKKQQSSGINALADIATTVPKLCTSVQVNLLETGSAVFSFFYSEASEPPTNILLNRVLLEKSHVLKLHEILKDIIDVPDNKPTSDSKNL